MSYLEEAFLPHLRLAILRVLAGAPGYAANSSILTQAVAELGLRATRDQVRGQLAWLNEQQLVRTEQVTRDLVVAELCERGHDAAAGAATVPGVQRPGPGG
ncbi:MAG: ArsR family transcriptional regulator [Pseudomonadota bacterium]